MSEEYSDLVRRVAAGDRAAADEFVRRFERPVRAVIRRRLGPQLRPRVDTDDLLQSTMAVAVSRLSKLEYRGEGALRGWLAAIAEMKVRMVARHHRAEMRDVRKAERLGTSCPLPGAVTGPVERAERNDEAERIRAAVSKLRGIDREAIELRSFEGLSFPEMARRLGLGSAQAARKRFERALARLTRIFDA